MEEAPPRFRFFSLTFLLGFGFGSFVGVALALLAIAIVAQNSEERDSRSANLEALAADAPPGLSPTPTPDQRPRSRTQLEVRLGPGLAFAIVGTLSRGEAIQVTGRDFDAGWVAIQFPPGSTGRGWVAMDDVDGISDPSALSVVAPTPLARAISTPTLGSSSISPNVPIARAAPVDNDPPRTATAAPDPGSPTVVAPEVTPTPISTNTDLVVTRVALTADRKVSVTVGNRGPADLSGQSVFVLVRDLTVRSEQLVSAAVTLRVGGTLTLQTQYLEVDDETDIQATVDPSTTLRDPDRTNNTMSVTLRPPARPTPTPTPQRPD